MLRELPELIEEVKQIFKTSKVGSGQYWRTDGTPCCILGHLMSNKGMTQASNRFTTVGHMQTIGLTPELAQLMIDANDRNEGDRKEKEIIDNIQHYYKTYHGTGYAD